MPSARVIVAIWRQTKDNREFYMPIGYYPRLMSFMMEFKGRQDFVPIAFLMTDHLIERTFGDDTIVANLEANLLFIGDRRFLLALEAEDDDLEYFVAKRGEWLVPIREDSTGFSLLLLAKFDQCIERMVTESRRIANRPRRR